MATSRQAEVPDNSFGGLSLSLFVSVSSIKIQCMYTQNTFQVSVGQVHFMGLCELIFLRNLDQLSACTVVVDPNEQCMNLCYHG